MRRALPRCSAVLLTALVASCVAGCSGSGAREPMGEGTSADSVQPPSGSVSLAINDSMADSHEHWDTGEFGSTARLEFVDGVYRMTAGGWPLISPSKDTRTFGLDPVSIEAAFGQVVGTGLYGVACGITGVTAYLFVVGSQTDGTPYYGIALLEGGYARSLYDSTVNDHPPAADIWQPGSRSTVAAQCERGSGVDQALLELSVDGQKVAQAQSSNGVPTGQVGLVAVSRSEDAPLVVDVRSVTVRSSPR